MIGIICIFYKVRYKKNAFMKTPTAQYRVIIKRHEMSNIGEIAKLWSSQVFPVQPVTKRTTLFSKRSLKLLKQKMF